MRRKNLQITKNILIRKKKNNKLSSEKKKKKLLPGALHLNILAFCIFFMSKYPFNKSTLYPSHFFIQSATYSVYS
jgi:hypothetical protein